MVITPTNFQKSVASALCAAKAADTPVGTYGKDGRLYIYYKCGEKPQFSPFISPPGKFPAGMAAGAMRKA